MGFSNRLWAVVVSVLLSATLARAQSEGTEVKVMVLDNARISSSVLSKAETEAGRIFRGSNIGIHWVNCLKKGERENCHHAPGANEFMLHIVPDGRTRSEMVFGEAFLGDDGSGKYADIFFNRVQAASGTPELDTAQLLGAVTAHELGHLLLGSRSHSAYGIMQPVWEKECLRRIWMGSLLFTREQAQSMQRRIDVSSPSLTAIRGPYRADPDAGYK